MAKQARPRRHGDRWQINFVDGTGRRRFKTYGKFRDARAALRQFQVETDAIRAGQAPVYDREKTFTDLADLWMQVKYRKRSIGDDEIRLRVHLLPAFSTELLTEITPFKIHRFERDLGERLSVGTVRLVLALLRSMLRLAVEYQWLKSAPPVRLPPVAEQEYEWIETRRELDAFLRVAAAERYPGLHPFYATAVYTGMRAGELCGLTWDSVSFRRRLITVKCSYTHPTKSSRIRHVPILDVLLPVLKDWEEWSRRQSRSRSGLVFANRKGKMHVHGARVMRQTYWRCLEKAGVKRVTFHALRHTFASHWVMSGGDLYRLQKILGHKSIDTTQRYAHLTPDAFAGDWGRFG